MGEAMIGALVVVLVATGVVVAVAVDTHFSVKSHQRHRGSRTMPDAFLPSHPPVTAPLMALVKEANQIW